jgi:hypothetical protein
MNLPHIRFNHETQRYFAAGIPERALSSELGTDPLQKLRQWDPSFAARVSPQPSGCWLWIGKTHKRGYGRVKREGREIGAHQWSYWLLTGAPPAEGLELDHLCRVPACVNPAHLEAVTHQENMKRGTFGARQNCKNGHEFTSDNTRIRNHNGHEQRECIACKNIRNAARDPALWRKP